MPSPSTPPPIADSEPAVSRPEPGKNRRSSASYPGPYGGGYPPVSREHWARVWHLALESSWILLLATLIGAGLGLAYILRAPVLYAATATIQAEQDSPNGWKTPAPVSKDWQAVDYLQTVAQSLASRQLLERVAGSLQLWTNADFAPIKNSGDPRAEVVSQLGRMLKVSLRRGTRLIDITATHANPRYAELAANALAQEYIASRARRDESAIAAATASLAKEAERLRKKLEDSENALQAYREQYNGSSLDERQNTVVAKLKELSTKATEAKSLRILAETECAQIQALTNNVEALLASPVITKDPAVAIWQQTLAKAENDFSILTQRYKSGHPKYASAQTQVNDLRASLSNAVMNAVETTKAALASARASEAALDEAMQKQESSTLELGKLAIKYGVLTREVESDRALYDAVLKGMKESSVIQGTQSDGIIRLIEPAPLPGQPVWPKKRAILLLGAVAGLCVGALIVFALQAANTTLKTVDEAELLLDNRVLATVPTVREIRKRRQALLIHDMPQSSGAEAFRTLRAALALPGQFEGQRVVLFTSAMPSEGKTFCAVNYAASTAQLGLTTVIIDADLRNPSASLLVGQDTPEPASLADVLSGRKSWEEALAKTKVENLYAIAGRTAAANPAELLATGALDQLVSRLLAAYDRVVIDSAPVNVVSDTLLILKPAYATCLVVRAEKTSSRHVLRCQQLLHTATGPLAGVILNCMPSHWGRYYGAYYDYNYHRRYGSREVYASKPG